MFLLAAGTSGPSGAAEPVYIVALGASSIHGKGGSLNEAYPAQLEGLLRTDSFNVQVINAGVDGETTTSMLFRMDSVIPKGTQIVILQPGRNDFNPRKHSLSVDQHLANIEAMISRLHAEPIKVVLCGDDRAKAAIAQRYNAVSMSCHDTHLVDGQHLDLTGHRTVAARLLPVIESMWDGNDLPSVERSDFGSGRGAA